MPRSLESRDGLLRVRISGLFNSIHPLGNQPVIKSVAQTNSAPVIKGQNDNPTVKISAVTENNCFAHRPVLIVWLRSC